MNLLMITGLVAANVGWLLVMYFVVKYHLETKNYTELDLIELKNTITLKEVELCKTLAGYKEAIINKTTSDIQGGLNGLANRLDDVEKAIQGYVATSKESTNTLVDNVEKYFNFYNESVMNSIVTITKMIIALASK